MKVTKIVKKKKRLARCYQKEMLEAGCDEAGRGCYAGPVFAAAVILPNRFYHPLLNDSKLVKPEVRLQLREYIEKKAVAYAVAMIDVEEIDAINILQAAQKAMHIAIENLQVKPECIAVDGNYFNRYKDLPHQCIIKGDAKYANIAAASILAKTYRDEYMQRLHEQFPHYNWHSNKGYGTAEHRGAIDAHGTCEHHRKSFNIFSMQLELFEEEMI